MSNNRSTQHSNSVIPSEGERLMQIVYVLLAIAIMLLLATYTPPAQVDASTKAGVADIVVVTNAERVLWGDCGVDLYPRPESGASGYCYVYEQEVVEIVRESESDTDDNDDAVITTPDKPSTTPDNTPKKEKKQHCDKGEGNGGEGCDPGNNPNKGNNDEDGNKKKDKKEK